MTSPISAEGSWCCIFNRLPSSACIHTPGFKEAEINVSLVAQLLVVVYLLIISQLSFYMHAVIQSPAG